ncbi:acyl-CoA dehydrogenase [Streptomyces sp. WAC05374]|uniref:acyl-CoA dehydrogenase family protein n=1 Tax=Streptomyces sp. WAC05374 TaxID=2487420 RepID=UPI000F8727D7|nr:acyl-CoA dehydrogenase family protein [Streptomyces sp. WAC05374]RST12921.1 acyl-CoA dehydrogenase [Streptomyces sp. WAC05374]TDF48449.1 acyl-CoA dehydrogenase [Streptomyces sp. WAC05374]TDF54995.1 acyl-CoA dehydrogenase [Streptomyces sp. WAC05374]TDF55383.1 acyl-CoA dehydrogenase [Streptomyces sp. WAC05374]
MEESVRAFRSEARAWLAAHVPPEPLPSLETEEGFAAHRTWEERLHAGGWAVVNWPERYGGRGVDLFHWLAFEEEYWAAGAPGRVSQNGIGLLAPTLLDHGTPEQCARVLPSMASGRTVWAQAWSEPEAGSDLASLRSRAVRTDGGWLLHGHKTWSSRAAFADRAFGIFRTDPEAARPHQGLTYLMFGLRAPGVTVRPIGRLDGKPAFAELFLDGVFVPDEDVIGAPGDGWRIAMAATGNERGLMLRSPGRFLAAAGQLERLWRERGRDAGLRDRVADAVIGARAYRLFTELAAAGPAPGARSSLSKVFWSEYDIALHETALDLLGPEGEVDGPWSEGYTFALAGPVYAGTNEIQRDIIAERLLGLPKGRR